jgi:hypothetical protein
LEKRGEPPNSRNLLRLGKKSKPPAPAFAQLGHQTKTFGLSTETAKPAKTTMPHMVKCAMSKTRARCTQTEVTRILKAAAAAGVAVRLEIADDRIIVTTGPAGKGEASNGSNANPWDDVLGGDHHDET